MKPWLLLILWLVAACTATDQALKNEVNIQQEDWNQVREQLTRVSTWLDEAAGCCDRVSIAAGLPAPDSLPDPLPEDTLRLDADSLFRAYQSTCADLSQLSRQAQRIDGQYQRTRQQFNLFYRKVFDNKLRSGLAQERLQEYRRHLDAFHESLDLLTERFDAAAARHNTLVEQIANSAPQYMGLGTERIERRH